MSSPFMGPIFAFLSSVTWAIGSAQYSRMTEKYSAFQVNFTRVVFALPLFILTAFIMGGGWQGGVDLYQALETKHFAWFTLSVFASYAFGDVLFLWSTQSIGVPSALAIASSYPILTSLLGVIFKGEHILFHQWIGLFLAVAGIVTVILSNSQKSSAQQKMKTKGVLLALATAICWAINGYTVANGGQDLNPAVANTVRMGLTIFVVLILCPLIEKKSASLLPKKMLFTNAWVFVIEAFGGSMFFVYGLSHSSLVLGITLSSLAPVISVPIAVALRLEKFSITRTFAIIVVAAGLALLLSR